MIAPPNFPRFTAATWTPLSPRRVLVASGRADFVNELSALIRELGYHAVAAYDGHEALVVADGLQPHIVFVSVELPKLDGLEGGRRIRALEWGWSAVLVAVGDSEDAVEREASYNAGFDLHLSEPVSQLRELMTSLAIRTVGGGVSALYGPSGG